MNRTSNRPFSRLAILAVAALAAGALVACGESDDASSQKLSFEVTGKQKKATTITAPKSAETGLAEITYKNDSVVPADLQLIRAEGDHTTQEVVNGLASAVEGKPYPDWFFAAGGIGLIDPGESATLTQVLQPGTYYAFDTEGLSVPGKIPVIKVTGEASDEELSGGDGTVKAGEYVFESEDPLPSGSHQILFENTGVQPHHMIASRLIGEATADEVEEAFKSNKGQPPLSAKYFETTAVIEGGESQLLTLDLAPGRYAFYCFITDRQGGKPHALKGMVDEIEVE